MLLAFMGQGGEYIGDEWVYLRNDGREMYGIPERIRVWDWHLRSLPQYRERIGRTALVRLKGIRLLERTLQLAPKGTRVACDLNRVLSLVKRQGHVDVTPARLFDKSGRPLRGRFDVLMFVVSHDSPEITVRPLSPAEVAQRMVHSLQYERQNFMSHYQKFRFAFPERRNELIERAEEMQFGLLLRAFEGKPTYEVSHPYPVSLPALFDATRALCQRSDEGETVARSAELCGSLR
jgi:hypothetical protein